LRALRAAARRLQNLRKCLAGLKHNTRLAKVLRSTERGRALGERHGPETCAQARPRISERRGGAAGWAHRSGPAKGSWTTSSERSARTGAPVCELTRTPRGLRGVRTGHAYQPIALCTYLRRGAACPCAVRNGRACQPCTYCGTAGAPRGAPSGLALALTQTLTLAPTLTVTVTLTLTLALAPTQALRDEQLQPEDSGDLVLRVLRVHRSR